MFEGFIMTVVVHLHFSYGRISSLHFQCIGLFPYSFHYDIILEHLSIAD